MQELLVATRHVLATDFRRGFFSQIDTLLDERYVSFYFQEEDVGTVHQSSMCKPLSTWLVSTWDYFGLTLFYASRVLVGTGRACYETLRPLAYSLLAELIHHVRLDLTLTQVVFLSAFSIHCFHQLWTYQLFPTWLKCVLTWNTVPAAL